MSGKYEIAGIPLETPLVNAAGSVNGASEEMLLHNVKVLASTRLGAITVGSFTVPEQAGSSAMFGGARDYYYDAPAGRTYESMGVPNVGIAKARALMPEILARAHDAGKPVIVSVCPTSERSPGRQVDQLIQLVSEMLEAEADMIEVDLTEPILVLGTRGVRAAVGYELGTLEGVFSAMSALRVGARAKMGLKLPPYINTKEQVSANRLADIIGSRDICDFITTSGGVGGHVPQDLYGNLVLGTPVGVGAMSGPATAQIGRGQLRFWRDLIGQSKDIVSTLGVSSGAEVRQRLDLGAAAVGGVTFLLESENQGQAIEDLLSEVA